MKKPAGNRVPLMRGSVEDWRGRDWIRQYAFIDINSYFMPNTGLPSGWGCRKNITAQRKEENVVIKLPKREFITLPELASEWRVEISALWRCLIDGDLHGHIRAPLMCVFLVSTIVEAQSVRVEKTPTNWEGYAPLSRYQCQRFYERGQLNLREFICDAEQSHYVLPDETDDLIIDAKRFGILAHERKRFEREHGVAIDTFKSSDELPVFDPSFRIVRYQGREHELGPMQAKVVRQLYDAALRGEPWQHGKLLLKQAGSQSFSVLKLFKRNPIGKILIRSTPSGLYRLAEEFLPPNL